MNENLIQQIPLFSSLPASEIQLLAKTLNRREIPANTVIIQEDDPGDRFFIVLGGQFEILKVLDAEEERILGTAGPGDYLGEMSLIFPEGRRSATVRARTAAQLLEMTQADFEALLNRQPRLGLEILRELIARLRNSESATIHDLQKKNRELLQAYQDLKAAQAQIIEKEKMEHELDMARKIQESLLPKELPELPGWQIEAYWQPARAVSGDFYDFIPFQDGRMGLVIGDVTNKGVPAALVMAITRSVLRTAARQWSSPGEILAQANELLRPDMPTHMFVTCLYAVLDPANGRMRFANASHNLPFLRTADGVVEPRAAGMPLGLLPGMLYEENEITLAPGECLLLYSDGIVEAHNSLKEMFGFPRLHELMANYYPGPTLIQCLLGELAAFTGPDWEQEDDITFLTLQRLPALSIRNK